MSDIQPAGPQTPFDSIRHVDEQGNEYWTARELMLILGYEQWRNFQSIIKEARQIYVSQGSEDADGVFAVVAKNPTKSGGRPSAEYDYRLTRHACYLVALSGDGTKSEIAAAKTYFAVKTHEREQEELGLLADPEAALEEWKERAIRSYMAHGFSEAYARNRVDGILTRKAITGKWVVSGIKQEEIPILTDQMHMGTFDISVETHKGIKDFPIIKRGKIIKHKGDLRPAMTPMEQAVITFAENVTMALHDERDSYGFQEISRDVDDGSAIARDKRLDIERLTGKPVVSPRNLLTERDGGLFGDLAAPENDSPREEH